MTGGVRNVAPHRTCFGELGEAIELLKSSPEMGAVYKTRKGNTGRRVLLPADPRSAVHFATCSSPTHRASRRRTPHRRTRARLRAGVRAATGPRRRLLPRWPSSRSREPKARRGGGRSAAWSANVTRSSGFSHSLSYRARHSSFKRDDCGRVFEVGTCAGWSVPMKSNTRRISVS